MKQLHHQRFNNLPIHVRLFICFIFLVIFIIFTSVFLNDLYYCPAKEVEDFVQCAQTHALTSLEKITQLQLVKALDDLLNSYNISYFICGGTLLGYARNKQMIPYDDDVDFYVNINQEKFMKTIFSRNDIESLKSVNNNISLLRYQVHSTMWKVYFQEGREENSSKFPIVDVIFYIESVNNYSSIHSKNTRQNRKYFDRSEKVFFYENDIFPLKRDKFENIDVWIPNNIGAFINYKHYSFEICLLPSYNHRFYNASCVRQIPCYCLNGHWDEMLPIKK